MTDPFFRLGRFSQNGDAKLCLVLGDDDIVELKSAANLSGQQSLAEASRLDDLLIEWDRNFDQLRGVAETACGKARRALVRCSSRTSSLFRRCRARSASRSENDADHVAGMTKMFMSALAAAAQPPPRSARSLRQGLRHDRRIRRYHLRRGMSRIHRQAELAS